MVFAEAELRKWWDSRSDEQRERLKQATNKTQLDPDIVQLLSTTGCPFGPVGGKWIAQPDSEWSWTWPHDVRTFIAEQ